MPRPRTVNSKIPDLPRGMREVRPRAWYWRGTDPDTKDIELRLRAAGTSMRAGKTPNEARRWWERHVSPQLAALDMTDGVQGTVEEIIRKYVADELPKFTRKESKDEYQGRVSRLRPAFGKLRYAKSEAEAMVPGVLSSVTITQHLHANRERASSANKDIQALSRMFRLAKIRWGLTAHNPCDDIEYLPEPPRDTYVDDDRYEEIHKAAGPVLKCMLEISTQTGAREGMIFDIRLEDFNRERIKLRVTKKKNREGWQTKEYAMTPDLWDAISRAMELRKKAQGGAIALPSSHLFITRRGKPYTKESFKTLWATVRRKLKLGSREVTFHDMRAKAASDASSDVAATELLHHADPKVTKRVYRRKIPASTPLPSAIGGRQ